MWLFHPLFRLCPRASAAQSRQSSFCSHHHHYHLLSIIHHPSWLGALGLDLKRGRGNLCCFRSDSHIQSQSLQSSSNDTTRKIEVLLNDDISILERKKEQKSRKREKKREKQRGKKRGKKERKKEGKKRKGKRKGEKKEKKKKTYRISPPQRFLSRFGSRSPINRHATHGLKSRIRQDKDSSMIRFQIVDLFPKENGPEIFTDEFDGVQGSLRTRFEDTVAVIFFILDLEKRREEGEMERGKWEEGERERERGIHLPLYKALSNTISETI